MCGETGCCRRKPACMQEEDPAEAWEGVCGWKLATGVRWRGGRRWGWRRRLQGKEGKAGGGQGPRFRDERGLRDRRRPKETKGREARRWDGDQDALGEEASGGRTGDERATGWRRAESQKSQKSMVDQLNRSIEVRAPFRNSFFAWASGAVIRALQRAGACLLKLRCVGERKKKRRQWNCHAARRAKWRAGAQGERAIAAARCTTYPPTVHTPTAPLQVPTLQIRGQGFPQWGPIRSGRREPVELRRFGSQAALPRPLSSQGSIFSEPSNQPAGARRAKEKSSAWESERAKTRGAGASFE